MPYKLDEKTHTIYIDAPSTTEIVNLVYPFDKSAVKPEYLKMGQERGTCVHKQIEMYIKFGSKIGCTCEKQVKTHIEQGKWLCDWWDKWIKERYKKPELVENEKIMYSEMINLTGIADCVVHSYCENTKSYEITIIDWKTTKEPHKEKEAMQVYLYGLLYGSEYKAGNFNYMVVNSNVKKSYYFTDKQMEQGKQDALKGLQLYKEKRDKDLWMN